ncbi:Hypothetical_protein [Hexamita inflata]|uniref:Hypothetical_protein n=1 Tax=Hexamita inflata TaxID=28002 RepID=A0AA86R7J6_9EUKA|nr:Hypothetical protein HINF_LOCUS59705 [Hexamita inflata]
MRLNYNSFYAWSGIFIQIQNSVVILTQFNIKTLFIEKVFSFFSSFLSSIRFCSNKQKVVERKYQKQIQIISYQRITENIPVFPWTEDRDKGYYGSSLINKSQFYKVKQLE